MTYIDAHNYLKRIYHGGGNPYALFYNMMVQLQDTEVKVVCDGMNSRKYRKDIHPGYKAGRDQGDDPVYWDVYENCKNLALCFPNNSVVRMEDGEADDYIAFKAKAGDTVISNDRDLWPLLDKGVTILLNASSKVDMDAIETKFGVRTPKLIYLYKALVGDTSDKIPGKRGFGAAAWTKMPYEDKMLYLNHFNVGNFTYDPKIMTDQAIMSWKLAQPWSGYTYTEEFASPCDPLEWINSRGIML